MNQKCAQGVSGRQASTGAWSSPEPGRPAVTTLRKSARMAANGILLGHIILWAFLFQISAACAVACGSTGVLAPLQRMAGVTRDIGIGQNWLTVAEILIILVLRESAHALFKRDIFPRTTVVPLRVVSCVVDEEGYGTLPNSTIAPYRSS